MFKPGYKFTNKKNPEKGIMSSSLGLISVVSISLTVYFTYLNKGIAQAQYGCVIFLSILFSITGLVLGIISSLEKDIYKVFPVIGIVLNTCALLADGFIFYMGIA